MSIFKKNKVIKNNCYYCDAETNNLDKLNGFMACEPCRKNYYLAANEPDKMTEEVENFPFCCANCGHKEADARLLKLGGELFMYSASKYSALVCKNCGLTAFYDIEYYQKFCQQDDKNESNSTESE